MKFRNPWIDPRIAQVQPAAARNYLLRQGWKSLGPAANPTCELFTGPGEMAKAPTVLLPLQIDEGPLLQRMIELVGEVALFEERYAGSVLDDLLRQAANGEPNGAPRDPSRNTEVTPT